ncbi:MAG: SpoIIE family protein phosphatase [Bacteroidetes bacterium]|jgi:ligand-binding sensor domain-containing protein|nr:SpoIIE family protein phosphatase [Bacteroidota bacterium]
MCRFPSGLAVVLLVVGLGASLAVPGRAQELPFTHYTSDDPLTPLPANGVTAIYQDDVGFLWLALSGAGLVRYDGRTMERYTTADGLAGRYVHGALQDAGGFLWVPSTGGLSVSTQPLDDYATHERIRFVTTYCGADLLDSYVTDAALAADSSGNVWVGTSGHGVLRYRCGDGTARVDTFRTATEASGENEEVYALALRRDGALWASLSGGTMLQLDRASGAAPADAFEVVPEAGVDATTTALHEDQRGRLWGGTYDGQVWRLGDGMETTVEHALGHWIRAIAETPDGSLWVASSGGGLLQLGPEGPRRIGPRHGLLSATAYGLGTDREGNLYVGQSQGLSKLPPDYRAYAYYTARSRSGAPPTLPSGSVTAVLPERDRLWIATPGGLVAVPSEGAPQQVQAADGLPTNELYALGRDADGTLWIGLNGPTTALHPAGERPPTVGPTETASFTLGGAAWQATSFRLFNVYAIRNLDLRKSAADTTRVPSTWFASYLKVACLVDGAWYTFRQAAGFPATASGGAVVDAAGRVWIATDDHGLYRSRAPLYADSLRALHRRHPGEGDGGREIATPLFEPAWTTDTGAPTDAVQTLAWHDGQLWIGTTDGLYVAEPSLAAVQAVDGLPVRNVVALAASPRDGRMWVGTNAGLAAIDPSTLAVVRTLRQTDGLLNDETSFINSVVTGRDGAVYFGSPKGLTVYRPHRDRRNTVPPEVVLRAVAYEAQSWGRNRFEAAFAALTFTRERAVRYQTRFLGYDEAWSEMTTDARVQITNLPALFVPRDYTLEVRAWNGDGVPSAEPLRYAFTVRPPWFASWWFVLGVLAATAGIGYVAYRRHLRRERFRQEVHAARTIQQKLQPARPLQAASFEVAGACVPAYEVGGDHFDYRWIEPERRVLLLLVDVEGKRMEGAFQAALVRGMMTTLAELRDPNQLAEAVARLNRSIYDALSGETAVAAIVGVLDVDRGRLRFVNAGCEPPVVQRGATAWRLEQAVACPPLGKIRAARYRAVEVDLEPNDSVVLCSDGVVEAQAGDGASYRARLLEGLDLSKADSAEAIARRILSDVDAFSGSARPTDDRTVIVLRRHASVSAASASSAVA